MNSSTSTETSPHALFESDMARTYCPNSPMSRRQWDPVLRAWCLTNAVPLFPLQHASKADAIFGEGATDEVYSAHNGLFLHEKVEHALNKGYIAIVPDGSYHYKVVVLDKQRREVHKRIGRFEVDGFSRYMDLDERQLYFKTASRPKLRYVWWRYMGAVLQTFYWAGSRTEHLDGHREVAWLDSFWSYCGRFVNYNQLSWFLPSRPGPTWRGAVSHGFVEKPHKPYNSPELESILRNEQRERQRSPVPDYEEIESDEGTQERGHNGEVLSGIANPVAAPAPGLANLQLRGDPNSSAASIYPSRNFIPLPPYSPPRPHPYPSNHPPSFPSASPSYPSEPPPPYPSVRPPPPPPPTSAICGQAGGPHLMLTWRGDSTTGNAPKTTRTMRTIRTARTSGDEYTARTEVTETVSTVSGDDDEAVRGDVGEQSSEEDDTSTPRFRSGELVASKLADLPRFRLDPRTPKPGHEQVHLATELRLVSDREDETGTPPLIRDHTRHWSGTSYENDGITMTYTRIDIFWNTKRIGNTIWDTVDECTNTVVGVKTETAGENGGDNRTETVYEEEINTEIVTTDDNNGR
ncbi:hypothetical protein NW752_009152 [Fusarium irregulare]|uniref:HNH nuclease domain-containing protein n=1 Tax=Fusarium irregulare TaxID=2494466 RepID=A0A9W8PK76_9HYPO|nr:hypothetical protein NW766_008677 [Fusarium irregulare]KAJ4009977.1 hypothetical protein NW752_009152 [Fusarium irregulare]